MFKGGKCAQSGRTDDLHGCFVPAVLSRGAEKGMKD